MTAEQKMQKIVEAAGECWHDAELGSGDSVHNPIRYFCSKCGGMVASEIGEKCANNPAPTDLNELFRLAEKLGRDITMTTNKKRSTGKWWLAGVWVTNYQIKRAHGVSPAEALLSALYEATK